MKPSELRQAIAGLLTDTLAASGWRESGYTYDLFPDADSDPNLHRTFAVGLLSDVVGQDRQRVSSGGMIVTTTLGVRFTVHITADAQVASYDAALDAEAEMIEAIAAAKEDLAMPLRIEAIPTRIVVGDGTVYVGEIRCSVAHYYPLTT